MLRTFLMTLTLVSFFVAPALAVSFDHEQHNSYFDEIDCADCHVADAFSIVPAKSVCEACHDADFAEEVEYTALKSHGPVWAFNHKTFGKLETKKCSVCHQQDFCLECHNAGFADEQGDFRNNMINVHRAEFTVTHPIAARTEPQLCTSCHENKFCTDCHDSFNRNDLAFNSHRRGFTDGTAGGAHEFYDTSQCQSCHIDSVLPSHQWSSQHAREARKNLITCQACHPEGDICLTCHSARTGLVINPHPKDWGDISGRLERSSGGRTCRKCH